ncbi:MAG: transketolase, beta subunit [Bacteroidetes bacterium]|jgi:transketolase|nr:transketolase, beta subunit [Bacteroidota bacterium]
MNKKTELIKKCEAIAARMRKNSLKMAHAAGSNGAHMGSCLCIVDIIASVYGGVLNFNPTEPEWKNRDRFILSKGHGSMTLFSALEATGIINEEKLFTFSQNGGDFLCTSHLIPESGQEYSNGTLGFGLSYSVGLALASRYTNNPYHVYVLLGDGECNEGSIWEAAMSAQHFKLSNLTAIVDLNRMQSDGHADDVLNIELENMWNGFNWEVIRIENGHSISQLLDAFEKPRTEGKPRVIIAPTIKGKGISFMENNPEWHHGLVTKEIFEKAMMELPD